MKYAILMILSFYFFVILAAFGLAICYFMQHKPEQTIPTTQETKIEYENGMWYGYKGNQYICMSANKDEVIKELS